MSSTTLPTMEKESNRGLLVHPAVCVLSWIFCSNLTILFNKWLIDTAGFRYPVILTCWHLVFATGATQLLARTTTLLDSRHGVGMIGRTYLRAVVPIGVLYSGSLVCSNLVYLYLSVAFIQMLKAAAPVAVLFASWAWGLKEPSWRAFLNISLIVFGVVLASLAEVEFVWLGFIFQLGGIIFEAVRIIMIEGLLKGEGNVELRRMDPLVSLYYYAPVCAAMNCVVALLTEASKFDVSDIFSTGLLVLLLNATVAFMLNVSSVFLIGRTSGLVLTLTGIIKNVVLIFASILIWRTRITALQWVGYTIAIGGLLVYSELVKWDHIARFGTSVRAALESEALDEDRLQSSTRRTIMIAAVLLLTVMLFIGWSHPGSSP
ncbi:triose-phosphate transporter [Coniochaeta sp. 2T2.1]|nr:triose-phosphate transporter [Coniochaeta sp. 2T2.1]